MYQSNSAGSLHLRDTYHFNQSESLSTVVSSNHDYEVDYGVAGRDWTVAIISKIHVLVTIPLWKLHIFQYLKCLSKFKWCYTNEFSESRCRLSVWIE